MDNDEYYKFVNTFDNESFTNKEIFDVRSRYIFLKYEVGVINSRNKNNDDINYLQVGDHDTLINIYKFSDEWYMVENRSNYYRCDTFDGVDGVVIMLYKRMKEIRDRNRRYK